MSRFNSSFSKFLAINSLHLLCINGVAAEPTISQDLSHGWRVARGDNPEWSRPDFDDRGWQKIKTNLSWEAQGFENYDGYAWYRLRFIADEKLRLLNGDPYSEPLRLRLGQIDDVDQTWFNGVKIGETGEFPETYRPAWRESRAYKIPKTLIR